MLNSIFIITCFQYLECWAHEESKGWRFVNVNAEVPDNILKDSSPEQELKVREITQYEEKNSYESSINKDESQKGGVQTTNLIDLSDKRSDSSETEKVKSETESSDLSSEKEKHDLKNKYNMSNSITTANTVQMLKTSCGDAHNIGLDVNGKAYSLPSPLDFNPFPNGSTHKVRYQHIREDS